MNYKIKNQNLIVEISDHGAEIKSAKYNDVEYMHDSNPTYWGRSAPILFPNIGTIKDGTTLINNKPYKMVKHGFLRDRDMTVTAQDSSSITFSYNSTESDFEIYPYHFNIDITYQIHGNILKSYIVVKNLSNDTMMFNLGLHPAFKVPHNKNENFEDYKFIFGNPGNYECPSVDLSNGTINFEKTARNFEDLKELPLNYDDYLEDALVFDNLATHQLTLCNKDNTHGVHFEFHDFPMLGIWTPNHVKANFICIEPWIGCADPTNHDGHFENKCYLQSLKKDETKLITYQIKFF